MRPFKSLAIVAALLLTLVGVQSASADPPVSTATEEFDLVIQAGTQFSVQIIGSGSWNVQPFSLTGPANWTNSTYFNIEVVDMRGTGFGWNTTASASAFVPAIANATVQAGNNTNYSSLCSTSSGFCTVAGFSNGVTAYSGNLNFSAGPATILTATGGVNSLTQPNGTGTFRQQNSIYYNNIAPGLAANTYTTTITVTLTGNEP